MHRSDHVLITLIILTTALLAVRETDHTLRKRQVTASITVYLLGQVAKPGAVTLPQGSRRIHAVAQCGGVLPQADLKSLSPAEHLIDGETIVVQKVPSDPPPPTRGTDPGVALNKSTKDPVLDLNLATAAQLQELPGIGPVLAQRIVEARLRNPQGTFSSLEDLTGIRGIKRKTLARFRPYLELEGI